MAKRISPSRKGAGSGKGAGAKKASERRSTSRKAEASKQRGVKKKGGKRAGAGDPFAALASLVTGTSKPGFTLGDHTFIAPGEDGGWARFDAPKKQILGAAPPAILDGLAREATKTSAAAKQLYKGRFCGHGEPTMTIFDIVIDGEEVVEVGAIMDPQPEHADVNVIALAVRKPGVTPGEWHVIFRREWEERQQGLSGITRAPLTKREEARLHSEIVLARVCVGFEYPCEATSRDDVSWMTIDAVMKGDRTVQCFVDAELA